MWKGNASAKRYLLLAEAFCLIIEICNTFCEVEKKNIDTRGKPIEKTVIKNRNTGGSKFEPWGVPK